MNLLLITTESNSFRYVAQEGRNRSANHIRARTDNQLNSRWLFKYVRGYYGGSYAFVK